MGRAFSLRSKECSASSLGTPGMSEGFHAKMSQLARRKEVSASSYAESRSAPIKAVLSGWLLLRTIAFVWLSGCSWDSGTELLDGF